MTRTKKWLLLSILIVVLIFGVYSCVPSQALVNTDEINVAKEQKKEEVLNKCKFRLSNGRQYMIQQSWADALRNYQQIIDAGCAENFIDPLFKDMAQCYMKLGKPDSSAFFIDQGLSYDATNQHLLQLSAYYKERAGDYEGAIAIYQQYNVLYLDDIEYLSKQANAYDMLGLYDEELDVWEYIIEVEPDNNDAINAIITVLGKMGRDPKAFYQKAWENNTSDASKALNYINALFNNGDYKDAITVAKQTLQFNAQNITLIKKLAECYDYSGQPEEGLKVLENYARSKPRDINMQIDVTLRNIDFENYEKAYKIISNAVKLAPQNREVYFTRGKVLETLAEMTTLEKGKIDCNDKIVYHMAYEDYKISKELGNFNAQFRLKYLYDNDLTIAKAKDRFLIGEGNKVNANTYKPLGASYSWITRTVTVK
ncbi:MAG: tetratricopeptide repeat protein [Candidatus Marinimicrobia bacterium]|nr:tetratricopeptide repeat protein [Candidatus Neomarinimicrobiota bacterium]